MAISINASVVISSTWTVFKSNTQTGNKSLPLQYDDDGVVYSIYSFDGSIGYICTIWKGTVPDGVINGGYSQSTNDTDKSDFETNYKPSGNKNLSVTWPLERAIASGIIPNGVSGVIGGYIGTSSTSLLAVRATAYTEPASAAQRSVSSSSASDASAGTGTRTMRITYYDNSMNGPFTEDITLNGTTAVNTVSSTIRFIEKMESLTVGSNGGNVGTITLFGSTAGGGGTVGTIAVGDGQTFWAHHYVRPSRTMFLRNFLINTALGSASANISLRSLPVLTANSFEKQYGTQIRSIVGQPSPSYDFNGLTAISGPARFTVYVKADAVTASTFFVNFSYYEI